MKPWSGIRKGGVEGGELGRRGVGSKRGCEATGLKWDFHLFIYLAELIAQGCLLAFCCMFCVFGAPSLLPLRVSMWAYLQVQMLHVCMCMHIYTSTTTPCVCLHCVSEHLCELYQCLWMCMSILPLLLHVCLCTLCLVWSESLSWCLGMNGIFWDRSVLLCVCQTSCASIAHTHKKSNLSLAVAEHNSWEQLRLCRTQQSESKSCFVLLFLQVHRHLHQPH